MTNSYDREIYFLDLKGEDANKVKVESYIKKQNPRTIFFNGHGSDKEICGFKDEILIEINKNEELLKDKIVYSLSCSSAKELGKNAVKKGAECFIGYKSPFVIYTDATRETTPLKDNIAASFLKPSNRLSISLLKGGSAQESSSKSKEEFRKEIRKYISTSAIDGADRIVMALLWDLNNQVVLGNNDARI